MKLDISAKFQIRINNTWSWKPWYLSDGWPLEYGISFHTGWLWFAFDVCLFNKGK